MRAGRGNKVTLLGIFLLFLTTYINANTERNDTVSLVKVPAKPVFQADAMTPDSLLTPSFKEYNHRLEIDLRPEYIIPSNDFIRGDNPEGKPIRKAFSAHLKYSFQTPMNSLIDRIYGGAYQGIGVAWYTFGEQQQIGNPLAFYLFQGARIADLSPRLSFNYEWNFGISAGWHPYNWESNPYNTMIGSKVNAYLNADFYFNWLLSKRFDLIAGITLTHFSNGNTQIPNAGMNTMGLKIGLAYNFNRNSAALPMHKSRFHTPSFPKHISYDVVLFGSWRRKGVTFGDKQVASPHAYTVLGFNFAPMYNVSYRFRTGISLDGVYDGSANVYTEDYISGTEQQFYTPSLDKQLALGLSARAEYVMPYFTIAMGLGVNILHRGGDLKAFYQMLALKIDLTHHSFLHIGYNIQDFHNPNYLMLGIGFRFHNKYPRF